MFDKLINSKIFKKRLKFLKNSQYDNKIKIKNYQTSEFIKLIEYAYHNVDFYKNYFSNNNLKLKDFKKLDDIRKLPIIDKEIIKQNPKQFISKEYRNKKIFYRTTAGSTGQPLKIYFDQEFKSKDLANTFFYMSIANGLDPLNYKSIRLYGDKIKINKNKKIFWKKISKNKYYYSCYDINDKNIIYYFNHLNKFKPDYIHARPSSIILLCDSLDRINLKINFKIKCIFLDGEVLHFSQRKKIEKILDTKIFLTYGHTEGSLLGYSCGKKNNIHFAHQVGIVEIINNKNKAAKYVGEVVVTGFNNKVMPLIRYNTNDIAKLYKHTCKCKRKYVCASEITGRTNSYVFDKNRNKFMVAPIIFNYNEIDWSIVKKFKIQQKKIGQLILNVVPINNKQLFKINNIAKKIQKVLKNKFVIKLKIKKELNFTKRGKFNYIKQQIKNL